jgi:ABC-2 type transport system ATP-binding protein
MGLIGANGAGKTTIIKLVMGLIRKDAGCVRILGEDHDGREAHLRERIGFVHETPAFYNHLTVSAMRGIVAPHYDRWDDGCFLLLAEEFELPLHKKVGTLSKGTRTKLALALALSHHAELVVMDEPTSGLDPVVRRRLLGKLQELIGDGATSVLFSTHITSDLERVADYVTCLHRGKVVFFSTRDEVRDRWAMVKGPPDRAGEAVGESYYGMRRGEVGFQVLTSNAVEARRRFGDGVLVEPATLEDIMYYLGRSAS